MKSYRHILAILTFLFIAGVSSQAIAGVEVLRSDTDGLRLVVSYTPDLKKLSLVGTDSTGYSYEHNLLIATPYGARASIVRTDPGHAAVLTKLPSVDLRPRPVVELGRPFAVRGRQLTSLTIRPVVGNEVYQAVEIEISFEGGMTITGFTVPDPKFDGIFEATIVNSPKMKGWPKPARPLSRIAHDGPFATADTWYCLHIDRTGVVAITGAQLRTAGLNLANLQSARLRLFYGGGLELDVDNSSPRPELLETAVIIRDGGDGLFEAEDSLIFFAEALNRWQYETGQPPRWAHHNFDSENVYWLTVQDGFLTEPLRMATVDGSTPAAPDTTVTSFFRPIHVERDSLLEKDDNGHILDFYRWWWTDLRQPSIFVPLVNVAGSDPTTITIAARTYHVWPDTLFDLSINGIPALRLNSTMREGATFETDRLTEGLNDLTISFQGSGADPPYLDYIEFQYHSLLRPTGNKLDCSFATDTEWSARIEIADQFDGDLLVLDLTDSRQPQIVTNFEQSGGVIAIGRTLSAGSVNRLLATTLGELGRVDKVERRLVTDLRSANSQADLIIITVDDLIPSLQEYIDYRTQDGVAIAVTTIDDICDNFAYGLTDPTAVRDYLKDAYQSLPAPAPSMVLFVGDGTYDYQDLRGFGTTNLVGPYIHAKDSSYGDDNFVYFGSYGKLDSDSSYVHIPDRGVDLMTARWPVRTAGQVAVITSKIKNYEEAAGGAWRGQIVLVADDEFADLRTNEIIHTDQTETLASVLPRSYNIKKIYSIEHDFVNLQKPTVNDAIVDAVNDGCLLVNYVGHGNPTLWGHEAIFTSAVDLSRLNNPDQLPLFFAASCAIGFYDDPERTGMAEQLLFSSTGGAVSVVSATRLVYAGRNHAFNKAVYEALFGGDTLSIGEAVYAAKILHEYTASSGQNKNNRAYVVFGDPCLKLRQPELQVQFDTPIDSLVALDPVTVSGQVMDEDGLPQSVDGLADIRVYDSDREKTYISTDHGGTANPFDYSVSGPAIYRGTVPITNGQVDFQFVPPLDIGYGGRSARLQIYGILGESDALGLIDSITVSEDLATITDSSGPAITYSFGTRTDFVDGDVIGAEEALRITLADSSGINLTGRLGHGITLVQDDDTENQIDLTNLFIYDPNDYTTGQIRYELDDLPPGRHSFKVKAWDNANNSSTAQFQAELAQGSGALVMDLLNYPNPMRDSTNFGFLATTPLAHFGLDIFTLSGRKVQSFDLYSLDAGYHQDLVWYGTDYSGDRVATGVYIYKATVQAQSGPAVSSLFGKVVVIN